jgi:hypothetical protein
MTAGTVALKRGIIKLIPQIEISKYKKLKYLKI